MAYSLLNKCDFILHFLYENRKKTDFFSIRYILSTYGVPKKKIKEPLLVADKLKKAGLIIGLKNEVDCFVQLNNEGVKFCRLHSFSFPFDKVANSVKTIINNNDLKNKAQNNNHPEHEIWPDVRNKIVDIKREIANEINLSKMSKNSLLDCLTEVENNVDVGKSPYYSFQFLLKISKESSEIEQKVKELHQLIFQYSSKKYGPEIEIRAVNSIGEIYANK